MSNENQNNNLETKPISPLGYVGYFWFLAIPFVGLILTIVWAFSHKNINVRNNCKGLLINLIIVIIVIIIFSSVIVNMILSMAMTMAK